MPLPATNDVFGWSVVGVGADRVLIGATGDAAGAHRTGAAYLFTTNGELVATFTNPTPATGDSFGYSVAAVGTERVLIGVLGDDLGATNAGVAYLFSTNGALITTFVNPTPAVGDEFGYAVAAVGSDRLLIGSPAEGTGTPGAGAVYLFSTNGALLTTLTNPTPAADDRFGSSVTAVGTERVLIGAYRGNTDGTNTGRAYLFSTNGVLLATFTNPTPTYDDEFGYSLAAVGSDQVVIGAWRDNTGASGAGAAYLFSLVERTPEAPRLTIRSIPINRVAISWPSPSTSWTLQQNTNGVASGNWSSVLGPVQDDGTTKTFIVSPPTGERFFRLIKP